MAKEQLSPATTLKVRRTFNAPRERVFRAWTDRNCAVSIRQDLWRQRCEQAHIGSVSLVRLHGAGRVAITTECKHVCHPPVRLRPELTFSPVAKSVSFLQQRSANHPAGAVYVLTDGCSTSGTGPAGSVSVGVIEPPRSSYGPAATASAWKSPVSRSAPDIAA